MNTEAKILIPNKEWILTSDNVKLGSVAKNKKGFSFFKKGKKVNFRDLTDIEEQIGIKISSTEASKPIELFDTEYTIYDFPCGTKPYSPVFNIKKKLPLFYVSSKSKSQRCAGHYIIKFNKRWVKSFCPKLITLERYPYYGPYKTESEIKHLLHEMNKV
jgi:hypothetical protein